MKRFTIVHFVKLIKVLFAAAVVLLVVHVLNNARTIGTIRRTKITSQIGSDDLATLTPDGSRVLILREHEEHGAHEESLTFAIEFYDAKRAALLSTTALPRMAISATPEVWQSSSPSKLTYCNQGRYLMAYLGPGAIAVFDSETLQVHSILSFPVDQEQHDQQLILSGACSKNAAYAVFQLQGRLTGGITKVFSLDSGKQIGEISEDLHGGVPTSLEVSSAGSNIAVLTVKRDPADLLRLQDSEVLILDLKTSRLVKRIDMGQPETEVIFAGEDTVAVAGDNPRSDSSSSSVRLINIHSGLLVRNLSTFGLLVGTPISVSSDGLRLLAYSGAETYNNGLRHITSARFSVWNTDTGVLIVESAAFPILKTGAEDSLFGNLMPWRRTESWRPSLELSQEGNAVLVSQMAEPVTVYTFDKVAH
jgi:hypothetical protein